MDIAFSIHQKYDLFHSYMMKYLFMLLSFPGFSQTKLLSWNLENFGKSKSESTLQYIAKTINGYDIIAIQEVVAGSGGTQAVAKLAGELNRTGAKWEYTVSNPTSSSTYKTERYAFLWKTARVKKIGEAWLEKKYGLLIDREPYYCTFQGQGRQFTVVNFHAITKSKQPETEIKYFKFLPAQYPSLELVFAGDFNCPQTHSVFGPLKSMGYRPILKCQKTSLKQQIKNGNCLASAFDNIFYNTTNIKAKQSGVVLFFKDFNSLSAAKAISDHIPIWIEIGYN